jgi:hypothetical protein
MARLGNTFGDAYTAVSEYLGLGSGPSGTDLTKVKAVVNRAYLNFLFPVDSRTGQKHYWSFLRRMYTLVTHSSQWRAVMPPDFSSMASRPHFALSKAYMELTQVPVDVVLENRVFGNFTSFPAQFAIAPVTYDVESGTRFEMLLWPTPNTSHEITFMYNTVPEALTTSTEYFVGGPEASEVILEGALAIAEQKEEDIVGIHTQLYAEKLQRLVANDVSQIPSTVGPINSEGLSFSSRFSVMSPGRWFRSIPTANIYNNFSELGLG